MADIFARRTALKVKEAEEGDQLAPGMVYTAPPNRHLLVNRDGSLSLSLSELVHFVRPSADLQFESVAASYKDRAIAVVLNGTGQDGSMGVRAIKKMGGTIIVQDEKTSEFLRHAGRRDRDGDGRFHPAARRDLAGIAGPGLALRATGGAMRGRFPEATPREIPERTSASLRAPDKLTRQSE